jgi:hypothetical protein
MSADALIQRIESVFPDRPLPEVTLQQAQLADQSMDREIGEEEWEAAGRIDRGVIWKDVRRETLIKCDAALSHTTEEGFVYYIPAYMRLALLQFDSNADPSWESYGSTISHLSGRSNYALGRYKRFNDPQMDAVIAFLKYVCAKEDFEGKMAKEALARYWDTPEARRRTIIHVP